MGDPFQDPTSEHKWQEWNVATQEEVRNPFQAKVNLDKPNQVWYYLGKTSTEARAQFTEDLANPRHNVKGNFLETVKPAPRPSIPGERRSYPASYPIGANVHALNGAMAAQRQQMQGQPNVIYNKPYQYKPKPDGYAYAPRPAGAQSSMGPQSQYRPGQSPHTYQAAGMQNTYSHNFAEQIRRKSTELAAGYPYQSQTYSQAQRGGVMDPRLIQHTRPHGQQPGHPSQSAAASRTSSAHYSQTPAQAALAAQQRSASISMMPNGSSPHPSHQQYRLPASILAANISLVSSVQYLHFVQQFPYLRNSHLRKPKRYQSPYASQSGFTDAYMPLPALAQAARKASGASVGPPSGKTHAHSPYIDSQMHSQRPSWTGQNVGQIYSPTPTGYGAQRTSVGGTVPYMYQTSQQFQQQVLRDSAQLLPGANSRIDQLMEQLKNKNAAAGARSSHSNNMTHHAAPEPRSYTPPTPPGRLAIFGAPEPVPGRTTSPSPAAADAKVTNTPGRPEYSPISDAGGATKPSAHSPLQAPQTSMPVQGLGIHVGGSGGETWRYLQKAEPRKQK